MAKVGLGRTGAASMLAPIKNRNREDNMVAEVPEKERFVPSRVDGRTDVDVLFDLLKDAQPGDEFRYEALAEVLQEGLDTIFTRNRIYNTVRMTNVRLQEERQRTLQVIRNYGYRILHAHESVAQAQRHERKAQNQVGIALRTVQHTRRDELTDEQRQKHDDYSIRIDAIASHVRQVKARRERRETLTENNGKNATTVDFMPSYVKVMMERLEKLEKRGEGA